MNNRRLAANYRASRPQTLSVAASRCLGLCSQLACGGGRRGGRPDRRPKLSHKQLSPLDPSLSVRLAPTRTPEPHAPAARGPEASPGHHGGKLERAARTWWGWNRREGEKNGVNEKKRRKNGQPNRRTHTPRPALFVGDNTFSDGNNRCFCRKFA